MKFYDDPARTKIERGVGRGDTRSHRGTREGALLSGIISRGNKIRLHHRPRHHRRRTRVRIFQRTRGSGTIGIRAGKFSARR